DVPPDKNRQHDRSQQKRHDHPNDQADEQPVALASALRVFGRNGRASPQQIKIANIRLPPYVEEVATKGNQATGEVDSNVHPHAQQSDLGNAITYGRDENVERNDRRGDVAELRNEVDDRVESEAPIEDGNSKLVVHQLREDFQLSLDLNRRRPQHSLMSPCHQFQILRSAHMFRPELSI